MSTHKDCAHALGGWRGSFVRAAGPRVSLLQAVAGSEGCVELTPALSTRALVDLKDAGDGLEVMAVRESLLHG